MPTGKDTPRSNCPIACALDLLGDRWTLVVLRDVLLAQRRTFSEIAAHEGIATNTLTDRLERLIEAGVLERRRDPLDGRSRRYVPTESGLDLIPVLVDLMVWGNKYTSGTGPAEIVARAVTDREALLVELIERACESDD
ncbi:MAG: helix-turn-helix transcriptional regulator [Synechococcales cyanobacterium K44_A2020_017]|nr:helix-turn-helix transcriptional regulator [Synechococcales cyanobacterium K32_A2020_035]MBF2096630.1 helix-turn-helix transcriptional regulator [Synechococcales cyanobacterium K44_A2020_017]